MCFIPICLIPRSRINLKIVIHASGPDRINVLPQKIGTQSLLQFMEGVAYVVAVASCMYFIFGICVIFIFQMDKS